MSFPYDIDTYEDDRVYFIDASRICKIVDDESERITTEIVPTDDPEKYVVRITTPVPRYYIKSAKII